MKNMHKSENNRLKEISDGYEVPFDPSAWDNMEELMDSPPPKKPFYFNFFKSLAMLLLIIVLYFGLSTQFDKPIQNQELVTSTRSEIISNSSNSSPELNFENSKIEEKQKTKEESLHSNKNIGEKSINFNLNKTKKNSIFEIESINKVLPKEDLSFFKNIKKMLAEWREQSALEKVYLHSDRPFYKPGETIWFSVYIRNAEDLMPSNQSDIVYVDWIAPNGNVQKKLKIIAKNGVAVGEISPDDNAVGGEYKLKTYTNWQQNFDVYFEKKITLQNVVLPNLRMELDFEKEAYGAGDEVVVQVDLNSMKDDFLRNFDFDYVVEIAGKEIVKSKSKTNLRGHSEISFTLPDDLKSNDGLINVLVPFNGQTESISRSIPIVLNQIDLQFFAESGNFIGETKNKVAFKAINEFGKPADVEGVILNKKGEEISSFKSYYMGMGAVALTPSKGTSYSAKITKPRGISTIYPLPKVQKNGHSLGIEEINDKEIVVDILTTEKEELYLIAEARNEIFYSKRININSGRQTVKISTAKLPIGISRLTLFDKNKNPRAERLVFVNANKKLDVKIETDKKEYLPREKVEMSIEVRDERGIGVAGQFSLAVCDDNLLKYADDKQANILSSLLLESDLKGGIEEPNFYFETPKEEDKKDRLVALDYLMMTQGWRGFNWTKEEVIADFEREYDAEKTNIGGTLYGDKGKKMANVELNLEGSKKKVTTDEKGQFLFENVDYSPNGYIIVSTEDGDRSQLITDYGENFLIKLSDQLSPYFLARSIKSDENFISGKVFDLETNEPLIGASVVISGSASGTLADFDGNFQIQVPKGEVEIEVSYLGYEQKGVKIALGEGEGLLANIGLEPAKEFLEEVQIMSFEETKDKIVAKKKVEFSNKLNEIVVVKANLPKVDFNLNNLTKKDQIDDDEMELPVEVESLYHVERLFYSPKYEMKSTSKERTDFRKTIYWNPNIKTNKNGKAQLEFYNSDDITTFKTTIEGIGTNGMIGRGEATYFTTLPFGMRVKVPNNVLTQDEMILPLVLSNNTSEAIEGTLKIEKPKGFLLTERISEIQNLEANESKTIFLKYKVKNEAKNGDFKFSFQSGKLEDNFEKEISVIQRGFPVTEMFSGQGQNNKFSLNINSPVESTLNAKVNIYGSLEDNLVASTERMLHQPSGCFEQTSSSNYPNLLVLDLLQKTKNNKPEIEEKAKEYLHSGYERLKSFEVEKGGFDWFGQAPAHEGLTAYGLMQFVDMQSVYSVEKDLIDRTAKWLLERRDGEGGWQNSKRGLHSWDQQSAIGNAYIVWAMTEAGFGSEIRKEVEKSYVQALESNDSYQLALSALSLLNLNDNRASKVIKILIEKQKSEGSWKGMTHSMTNSTGKSLEIETTALAALALMKNGNYSAELRKGMEFITASKTEYGFGSTQSTVLAMKALVAYSSTYTSSDEIGEVSLFIDGKRIEKAKIDQRQTNTLTFDGFEKHLKKENQTIELKFSNKEVTLPFDISVQYSTLLPPSSDDCKVSLVTGLEKKKVKQGKVIGMEIILKNESKKDVSNPITVIGIPAGLSLQAWQLKELLDKEICDYYELKGNYLVLYFRGMNGSESKLINLDLKADITGNFESPASVAYLYYENENRFWVEAERILVD